MASRRLQDSNRGNAGDFIGESSVTQSCAPCKKTNISKIASVFCKDCDEYLCDTCKNPHTVYKPGKHEIVNFQDKKSAPVIIDMNGMDKCHDHGRDIEFFCQDHSKLCCSSCVLIHRKCDQVNEIAKVSERSGPQLHVFKQLLIKLQSEAEAIIAECKQSETSLNESIAKISLEVDKMRNRVIKLFEYAKQKLITEANEFKTAELKQIGNKRDSLYKAIEEISKDFSMCGNVLERGTPSQQYIYSELMNEKRKTIESNIYDQRKIKVASTVTVSFSKKLTSFLEVGSNFMHLNYDGDNTEAQDKDNEQERQLPKTPQSPITSPEEPVSKTQPLNSTFPSFHSKINKSVYLSMGYQSPPPRDMTSSLKFGTKSPSVPESKSSRPTFINTFSARQNSYTVSANKK
ncbi:hypothetical protein DPMN_138969 [Dreissena polymorpha]|uniref:B box-type domain-containing protein n=1 Tax=Dreissena polymorpha TaxID=45954 RepID=A0A9D4JF77_DREPO|nr:hypothetical protein DPMN_138969 [Dreissena polymorpha]